MFLSQFYSNYVLHEEYLTLMFTFLTLFSVDSTLSKSNVLKEEGEIRSRFKKA
jgi:hypothetical protein